MYNTTNLQVFNYGNNNPVKYNDPTGRISMPASAYFEEAMSIATTGIGVAVPAAPAIPYFKGEDLRRLVKHYRLLELLYLLRCCKVMWQKAYLLQIVNPEYKKKHQKNT